MLCAGVVHTVCTVGVCCVHAECVVCMRSVLYKRVYCVEECVVHKSVLSGKVCI